MHEQTTSSALPRRSVDRVASGVALVLCAAVLASLATDALAVNRCEDRNGRVTYTDEPCPPTARSARRVDDSAPVQVRDSAPRPVGEGKEDAADPKGDAAKGDVTKGEAAKGDVAKSGAARSTADKGTSAGGELRAGRIVAAGTPEQEIQRLDELRARQQRQCSELTRKVDYARADLQATSSSDRASAELALRRLQEEARTVCPR